MDKKDPLEEILGIFDDDITDMSTTPNMSDTIKEWKAQKAYIEQLEQIVFWCVSLSDIMRECPREYQTIYSDINKRLSEES